MTRWLWLLALPLGSVLYAGIWLRRRWIASEEASERARVDAAIAAKGQRQIFTGHDESLRLKTEARRRAADAIRSRAAHVESGAKAADVLRIVKKA